MILFSVFIFLVGVFFMGIGIGEYGFYQLQEKDSTQLDKIYSWITIVKSLGLSVYAGYFLLVLLLM